MHSPASSTLDAMIFDEPQAIDPRLDAFLTSIRHRSTSASAAWWPSSVPELAAHAIAAARALGRRMILAGGWAGLDLHVESADDILTIDAMPHHVLFPRVAALVHHGGAGTRRRRPRPACRRSSSRPAGSVLLGASHRTPRHRSARAAGRSDDGRHTDRSSR
jgi:hypothetical protein